MSPACFFVAGPIRMIISPEANGSSVPQWPILTFFILRLIQRMRSYEVGPDGLSTSKRPPVIGLENAFHLFEDGLLGGGQVQIHRATRSVPVAAPPKNPRHLIDVADALGAQTGFDQRRVGSFLQ